MNIYLNFSCTECRAGFQLQGKTSKVEVMIFVAIKGSVVVIVWEIFRLWLLINDCINSVRKFFKNG